MSDAYTAYELHNIITVKTNIDTPIPEYFESNGEKNNPDILISQEDLRIQRDSDQKKRSGAFFYWTEPEQDRLVIEYEIPIINAQLVIEDLAGQTEVRFTEAFVEHGDIHRLTETLLSIKLIQQGHPIVHTASLSTEDGATLLTALRDTGKTSTVLSLLDGDEFRFMSDDLVLLDEYGNAKAWPRPVNISPYTLTGEIMQRSTDLGTRVKRYLANSRFEILFGDILGISMGERKTVPQQYIDEERAIDRVFVLSAGDPKVKQIGSDQLARKVLINTLELFSPFSIYSLNFYAHALDYDILQVEERQRNIIHSALDGVECYEVSAYNVKKYPELIRREFERE